MVWPSATPRAPFVLAEGSSLLQTARPVRVDMYVRVCVIVFGVWTVSDSVCFVCYVPARWRCRVWASSRALGGCPGTSVSVVCALLGSLSRPWLVPCPCVCAWCLSGTACGVMCMWCVGWMPVQRPGWGVAVCGSCSVVGLRWWTGVCCVCLWLFPARLSIPNHRVSL